MKRARSRIVQAAFHITAREGLLRSERETLIAHRKSTALETCKTLAAKKGRGLDENTVKWHQGALLVCDATWFAVQAETLARPGWKRERAMGGVKR